MHQIETWVCRSCAALHKDRTDLPEACRASALKAVLECEEDGVWYVRGVEYVPTARFRHAA
jgi:hypothetical protein